jgi:hypothetical protein
VDNKKNILFLIKKNIYIIIYKMSNHANFTQNRQQTAELRSLSNKMTSHSTSVDALKTLQTKTFTAGTDPTEILSGNVEKQYSVIGGVDLSTTSLTKINPVKVDDNGLLECKVIGNTSADGTGDSHHIHVDSNGNARVSVVSSVNVLPADALNGDTQNDPANSISVALKGRSNIADSSTSLFLLSDSSGRLQVSVPQTTGVKLEDLSSTIDADHVNNSRSLPMTVKARQTIGDHTTGTYLKCDSNGLLEITDTTNGAKLDHLSTDLDSTNSKLDDLFTETRKTQASTLTSPFPTILADSASATQDLGTNFYRQGTLHISGDMAGAPPTDMYLQLSSDGSNWTTATGISFVGGFGGGSIPNFFNVTVDNPLRYWRFYNNDSVNPTGAIDNVFTRLNQE